MEKKNRKKNNQRPWIGPEDILKLVLTVFNKYLRSCAHAIVFNANNKKILPYGFRMGIMTRDAHF